MKFSSNPARVLTTCLLFILAVIFSCKKETSQSLTQQDEQQANMAATESDAEADGVFNGFFDDVMGVNTDVGMGGTGLFMRTNAAGFGPVGSDARTDPAPPCLVVTIVTSGSSSSPFPITVTMDFGAGCTCGDGHVRKGKIVARYSDRLLHPHATANIQFNNFSIDSIQLDNSTSFTISNTGTADRLQLTIDVSAKLNKPNGNYTEWHSQKVITRIGGGDTTTPLDDVMQIEGSTSGTVKRNDLAVAWKAEITNPFIKRFTCRWISQGTIKVGRESLSSNSQWIGTLDYGNGICDNQATLTLNGVTYQITLH